MAEKRRDSEQVPTRVHSAEQLGRETGAGRAEAGPDDQAERRIAELEQALRAGREDLQTALEDLDNLLAGGRIGALYLDTKLCIRKITPLISRVTRIQPTDLGRPVRQIDFVDSCPQLMDDLEGVLDSLQPVERTLEGPDQTTWLVYIRPYRTAAYAVEGVLLTLVEATRWKQMEEELAAANGRLARQDRDLACQEQLLQYLLEGTASLKLFVDGEKRLRYLNSRAKTWFAVADEDWALPAELDDVFALMHDETELRLCQAVPLEGGGGRRSTADIVAEPARDKEGRLLGLLYTIQMEGGA